MFTPGDHHGNGVVIPDFSLHWMRGVANFYSAAGDTELVEKLFPAVEKVLQWFARQTGDNGLLTDIPYWHFIEWAHVDRSGESAPINALYVAALAAASRLADAIQYTPAAARYRHKSVQVADALNIRHWSAHRGAYVDSVDADTGVPGKRVSQHTNALMIAFDLAPKSRWAENAATISDDTALKFTAAPPIAVTAPKFGDLSLAQGAYPTPLGTVNTQWREVGSIISMRIDAPDTVGIEVTPPQAYSVSQQTDTRKENCRIIEVEFSTLSGPATNGSSQPPPESY